MPRSLLRVRFAVVTAIVLGLLVSGVAIGAAGSALIIGVQTNNAGTSDTQLITNSTVIAFKLLQNGPGTALMGYATPTTGGTRGVYGRVDSPDGFGVQARNQATTHGSGAAIQAFGVNNNAIIATSDDTTAIVATADCSGLFCGADGIRATGAGLGVAVNGDGNSAIAGVYGQSGVWGLWGVDTSGGGTGLALKAEGDVDITGDLTISGTCTGCILTALAVNGGKTSLTAGDAVTIRGMKQVNGRTFLIVDRAKAGDSVVGLVAGAVTGKSRDATVEGRKAAQTWKYAAAGDTVRAGALLKVVTSGILTSAPVDAASGAVSVGDALAVGSKPGHLARKGADGSIVGYALGKVGTGTAAIAVYVAPR